MFRPAKKFSTICTLSTFEAVRRPVVLALHIKARFGTESRQVNVEEPVENNEDAFRLFSLPLAFKINESELRSKYREIMKDLHPDKLRNQSQEHQVKYEQHAAVITHAYDVLKRPHLRAIHLLNLLTGVPNDKETTDEDAQPPQEFLMLIMELGELIESACTDVELKPYFDANQKRIRETCQKLEQAFEESDLKRAGALVTELKYWNRIDETLRGKMGSLE
jgi:molecular chaperone HscB